MPPWREADRLAALDSYEILDTPPEPKFDDLVALAADICETPIALLNLVTRDRQWFKAETGLGLSETPIDSSICAHLLRRPGITVIPDLKDDDRFACNPLVTGEPRIRFYAAALLETPEKLPIGTLCVLDLKPRPQGLTERQRRALATLSAQAMDILKLRQLLARREAAQRRERAITRRRERVVLASLSDGVFALDREWRIILFNRAAQNFFGLTEEEVLGQPFGRMIPTAVGSIFEERYREVMESGVAASFEAMATSRPDRCLRVHVSPMEDGLAISFSDITEQKRAEEVQRTLIAELQHRTRNLLAVVRSIASQTLRANSSIETFAREFNGRLAALSRVQALLSRGSGHSVSLGELVEGELAAHGADVDGRSIIVGGPDVQLPSDAVQVLSLALHELATNAVKYGALRQDATRLSVLWDVSETDGQRRATIRWIEEDVTLPPEPDARYGFGRQLIERALPYDLGADTDFAFTDGGVRCSITLRI